MTIRNTLLTSSKIALLLAVTASTIVNAKDADARWADYKTWQKINARPVTGDHTGFLGGLHEAAKGYREVYVNAAGLETSMGSGPYNYPIGTVIAKEQYKNLAALEKGKKPGLTVMVKVSDDAANPADNWLWSRGYKKKAKQDTFCSSCHTIALPNDFVFSNATSLEQFN